jgi:5-hydroxyisourate hydrolase
MSGITTHVLDTSRGQPAGGVPVALEFRERDTWRELGRATTDDDGRVQQLLPAGASLIGGSYRLKFQTETYFTAHDIEGFYPEVSIVFEVRDVAQHYHVPLLLSPFGYSTYRGS